MTNSSGSQCDTAMLPTASSLSQGVIWKMCEKIFNTFNASQCSPDSHVNNFIAENNIEDPNDISFLHQIIYGLTRYEKFITVVVESFMKHNHAASPSDRTTYMMITYLAFLRLGKELPLQNFRKLLRGTLEITKILSFLRFIWKEENVEDVLIPQWLNIFEEEWIRTKIIENVNLHRESVIQYTDDLEKIALGKNVEEKNNFKPTVPEPFNITKPHPKKIPYPEVINTTFKRKEVPLSTYQCDPVIEQTLKDFKEGKTRITKYEVKRPKEERVSPHTPCVTERIPVKDIETVKEILNKPVTVKLNVAAILREDAIYRKKQEKEMNILKQYEEELRDSSEFYNWQDEMKDQDERERQVIIEKRKLEAMLTDERARRAKIKQAKENKKNVEIIREKQESDLKEAKKREEEEVLLKKKQAEELNEQVKEAVTQAKHVITTKKFASASEIRENRKENEILVAERLEIEKQRKEELIRQIRAMEAVPYTDTFTTFDPTDQPNNGLMIEMSYAELQARLKYLKEKQIREKEERRQEILNHKREKESKITERAKKIAMYRQQAKKENIKLKEKRKIEEKEQREKAKDIADSKLLELHEKLMKERNERWKEMKERAQNARQRTLQQQFLGASKHQYEQKHWEEQEKGLEREVKVRVQNQKALTKT